ncbi:hypothetical protein APR04_005252 [Promicromonospora umidemergens]|uniref:Immunity protein 63 of polymorphic toxin system n=1 Tax=Promicromonospora umidemergens TaxID=629679 RepID=A0ABP8YIB3_9MICO|nr:hypothetical protein [Promicromonospora umidemergens]MCP2286315.1 hypothetical protein [Promicromonospora umidemergens]
MRQPIDSALSVAQGIVDQLGSRRGFPTAEQVISVVHTFERIEFDVPSSADSDGFLFQYGEVNWFSEPVFAVGFVRQMELVDDEEDHEGYSQVQFEFRYRADADLRSLESRSSWWFRDSGALFEEWIESVKRDPIWGVIREKIPLEFDVSQELP